MNSPRTATGSKPPLPTYAQATAKVLLQSQPEAMEYLLHRGLDYEDVTKWGFGFWNSQATDVLVLYGFDEEDIVAGGFNQRLWGRVTLPLTVPNGKPGGLVGRALTTEARIRWLYPGKDSPFIDMRSNLLGLDQLLGSKGGTVILTEGPMDAVLMQKHGYPAVCCHGTSFTQEQALLLRSLAHSVYLMPDGGDADAKKNMLKSSDVHKNSLPRNIHLIELPDGQDPADASSSPTLIAHLLKTATRIR